MLAIRIHARMDETEVAEAYFARARQLHFFFSLHQIGRKQSQKFATFQCDK